jgi:hypothetical protein
MSRRYPEQLRDRAVRMELTLIARDGQWSVGQRLTADGTVALHRTARWLILGGIPALTDRNMHLCGLVVAGRAPTATGLGSGPRLGLAQAGAAAAEPSWL